MNALSVLPNALLKEESPNPARALNLNAVHLIFILVARYPSSHTWSNLWDMLLTSTADWNKRGFSFCPFTQIGLLTSRRLLWLSTLARHIETIKHLTKFIYNESMLLIKTINSTITISLFAHHFALQIVCFWIGDSSSLMLCSCYLSCLFSILTDCDLRKSQSLNIFMSSNGWYCLAMLEPSLFWPPSLLTSPHQYLHNTFPWSKAASLHIF